MTKFNQKITEEIIQLYSQGVPLKHCASAVGIDRTTIRNWMNKGKNAKSGAYRKFYLDMMKARAEFILYHQNKVANNKDWRASKYLLEVTEPETFVIEKKIATEVNADVRHDTNLNEFAKILRESLKNVQD